MINQPRDTPLPHLDTIIHDASLLDRDGLWTIGIREGKIVAIDPDFDATSTRRIDARGGLVTPSFVDPHFHLDKVLSRDYVGALSYSEAFARAREAKAHFTVADVEARVCAALDLAVAQGLGAIRSQVDVDFATGLVSLEGVLRARERFSNSIDIQIVAFPQEGIVTDPKAPDLLREALGMGIRLIGGLPEFEQSVDDQKTHIKTILDIAQKFDAEVDMHCDYTDLPQFKTLEMLADMTVERGLQGRVTADHCCALAVYPDDEAARVIDKILQAGIGVIILPIANLQMLGGDGTTPVNRGSSRAKELLAAGVNVCAGADNMYDIWFRFNRMDPVDTAYMTCLSAGMRTDAEVREAFEMTTSRPADLLGIKDYGVNVGCSADLVVHSASNIVDLFRNVPARRYHLRRGILVGGVEGSTWTSR
ncbi:amidohydrolase family protein [Mesorhizobium marinum]|uniref:amidohydrolase family protein n=1 Tax=Mesorhizobium marinum TaxID=3228790 RepID=UPI003467A6CF